MYVGSYPLVLIEVEFRRQLDRVGANKGIMVVRETQIYPQDVHPHLMNAWHIVRQAM